MTSYIEDLKCPGCGEGQEEYPTVYWLPQLEASVSEQNVYQVNVCLVNTSSPYVNNAPESGHSRATHTDSEDVADEENPEIEVKRSRAIHDIPLQSKYVRDIHTLVEIKSIPDLSTCGSDSQYELNDNTGNFLPVDNPNILKLTRMKWLSEGRDGSVNASPASVSPNLSPKSSHSSLAESDVDTFRMDRMSQKYLSTIIQLDKEHNMFGLARLEKVISQPMRRVKKTKKAVFHQLAIVQVCCTRVGCKNKSNSDLPSVLKCGSCRSCTACPVKLCPPPGCNSCAARCPPPRCNPSPTCLPGKCCTGPPPSKNATCCSATCGFKLKINRKIDFEPSPVVLTPRSSCILSKPAMARPCTHCPPCMPPSSCFPYLMPCYWPARAGAPCTYPQRCYHKPPCPPARRTGTVDDGPCVTHTCPSKYLKLTPNEAPPEKKGAKAAAPPPVTPPAANPAAAKKKK